jgi:hypothetical protein
MKTLPLQYNNHDITGASVHSLAGVSDRRDSETADSAALAQRGPSFFDFLPLLGPAGRSPRSGFFSLASVASDFSPIYRAVGCTPQPCIFSTPSLLLTLGRWGGFSCFPRPPRWKRRGWVLQSRCLFRGLCDRVRQTGNGGAGFSKPSGRSVGPIGLWDERRPNDRSRSENLMRP